MSMRTETNLEFSRDQMREMADQVVARCIDHIATLDRQPSCGDVDPARAGDLCRSMREAAPERGTPLDQLLDPLFRDWIPRSFTSAGPGYIAYIPGGGLYPAALADFIADATNRYTGVWQAAPALVQLEANALDWLREWMDFPEEARGLFTTGGSMATFNAIVCARERHLGAEIRPGVLYTSDQAHHSVLKSAKLAGVMPDRVRAIESDARFRLRVDLLREQIAADAAARSLLRSKPARARAVARLSRPAGLAVGEAARNGGVSRGPRRKARADPRGRAPRRRSPGHRRRRCAGAVALRVPPHVAGRDASRPRRG